MQGEYSALRLGIMTNLSGKKAGGTTMKYAYAVTQPESWPLVFGSGQRLIDESNSYLAWLRTLGEVNQPRGIVFHDLDSATRVFSTYALPAWTDHGLVHVDPIIDDWKRIYLSTLTPEIPPVQYALIRNYYESLEQSDVATIVAHELTHHLHIFADTPEEAMWFEEGFCFFLPRKHLLTAARAMQLQAVEQALIERHTERLGGHPIWQFGLSDRGEGWADALFDYWRAIRTVSTIADTYAGGESKTLLALFSTWKQQPDRGIHLHEFLIDALGVSTTDQQALWLLTGNP
jgi:hypothetical protein